MSHTKKIIHSIISEYDMEEKERFMSVYYFDYEVTSFQ